MRNRIGIAAAVLLALAAVTYWLWYSGFGEVKPMSACLRLGAPLFFLWLAWNDIASFPRWVLQASVPVTILVAIYPKLLFVIIPVVLLMLFIQPKKSGKNERKTKNGNNSSTKTRKY